MNIAGSRKGPYEMLEPDVGKIRIQLQPNEWCTENRSCDPLLRVFDFTQLNWADGSQRLVHIRSPSGLVRLRFYLAQ